MLSQRQAARPRSRSRLGIEPLEDRTVPSIYWVTNLNDAGPGSLRQAVADANAAGDQSTIRIAQTGVETLTGGPLVLTGSEQIIGPRADALVLRGDGSSRLLTITPSATVEIDGVTLENGAADAGGAVDNAGTLTLSGCTLTGNQATPTVANANPNLPTGGGGAILNEAGATLTLDTCTLTNNVANALNDTLDVFGGGVLNLGTATVTNSTFTGNQALGGGGSSFFAASCGGAIDNFGGATLTVDGSTFTGNLAAGTGVGDFGIGGAIENNAGLTNVNPSTATIIDSTFTANQVGGTDYDLGNGGAIDNEGTGAVMRLDECVIADNLSVGGKEGFGVGGGIMNYAESILTMSNSTVSGNVDRGDRTEVGNGGGIHNLQAIMAITGSTIIGNATYGGAYGGNSSVIAISPGPGLGQGLGGGISNVNHSTLSISDSTIEYNRAIGGNFANQGGLDFSALFGSDTVANTLHSGVPYVTNGVGAGGGIVNINHSNLTMTNCAVSNNIAQGGRLAILREVPRSAAGSRTTAVRRFLWSPVT